jgi:hypothetical protein
MIDLADDCEHGRQRCLNDLMPSLQFAPDANPLGLEIEILDVVYQGKLVVV